MFGFGIAEVFELSVFVFAAVVAKFGFVLERGIHRKLCEGRNEKRR